MVAMVLLLGSICIHAGYLIQSMCLGRLKHIFSTCPVVIVFKKHGVKAAKSMGINKADIKMAAR